MAYLFDDIDNFIEPPDESEICESAIQQQNFVELSDNDLDSPKGSIQSKQSSDEEEEKTEKKKEKKKKEAKVKDFSIAKKVESLMPSKEKAK